ncbi:hypothetical protein ACFFYR_25200, partial [Paraburkholderia dipogonis]
MDGLLQDRAAVDSGRRSRHWRFSCSRFVWNDYFWALCLTQGDDAAPITVGVAALKGQWDHGVESRVG